MNMPFIDEVEDRDLIISSTPIDSAGAGWGDKTEGMKATWVAHDFRLLTSLVLVDEYPVSDLDLEVACEPDGTRRRRMSLNWRRKG